MMNLFFLNMSYRKAFSLVLAISLLVAVVFLFFLPEQVPMQWGIDDQVNYYAPKYLAVLVIPVVAGILGGKGLANQNFAYLGYSLLSIVVTSGLFVFICVTY
ncbi:DUF1648 domain-containing protein [Enterococcus diestrammenae]|uniref:DUF1648 domain-containing protein n=1 Tax=Enterococcus diestrammenae TaxID=1155073 RepID=UPI00195CC6F0